jgi:hypothetical protein
MLKGKATEMSSLDYNGPNKTKNHNIGIEEAPKMEIIGY